MRTRWRRRPTRGNSSSWPRMLGAGVAQGVMQMSVTSIDELLTLDRPARWLRPAPQGRQPASDSHLRRADADREDRSAVASADSRPGLQHHDRFAEGAVREGLGTGHGLRDHRSRPLPSERVHPARASRHRVPGHSHPDSDDGGACCFRRYASTSPRGREVWCW